MGSDTPVLVLCNGASRPDESSGDQGAIVLDYRDRNGGLVNVKLGLREICPRCVPLAGPNTGSARTGSICVLR